MKWNTQKVVVTGAAGDLGRRLVSELGERGARVAAWDLNRQALDSLVREASKQGHDVQAFEVDVTDDNAVKKAAKETDAALGGVDLWFNYAGFSKIGEFSATSWDDLNRIIDVNIKGVVWCTQAALSIMKDRGTGRIVNMASVAGHIGGPYIAPYCATKHAIVGFTRALRTELALQSSNVKLVLVSPGFVESQMISLGKQLGFPEWLKWMLSTPDVVTREVIAGLEKGRSEIFPTLNGRLMLRMQKTFPSAVAPASRILLTRSWKDVLLNRYASP